MNSPMPRYVIRQNPGTHRWIMYCRMARRITARGSKITIKARYEIMGNADTLAHALEGIYE